MMPNEHFVYASHHIRRTLACTRLRFIGTSRRNLWNCGAGDAPEVRPERQGVLGRGLLSKRVSHGIYGPYNVSCSSNKYILVSV